MLYALGDFFIGRIEKSPKVCLFQRKEAEAMKRNGKITALYECFGRDDEQQGESNSISNQKILLEDFSKRQGFTSVVHFTDDGISGTCFDRP